MLCVVCHHFDITVTVIIVIIGLMKLTTHAAGPSDMLILEPAGAKKFMFTSKGIKELDVAIYQVKNYACTL